MIDNKFKFIDGIFKLTQQNKKTNKTTVLVEDHNIVVNKAFDILSSLMTSADSGKIINTIKCGDGGVVNNVLQTPAKKDIELYRETFSKTGFTNITINTVTELSVTFSMSILEEEGNGVSARLYSEAGLFSNDGTMFSRKCFPEQLKTIDNEWLIEWTIIFK